jgi:Flp pilus assembly protein TadG
MMNPRRLNVRQIRRLFESRPEQDQPAGASRGQVLVMFALFLTGLISMLGMATDLGYAFSQRRASQNAADAGALAGARMVLKQQVASGDAATEVTKNAMNGTTVNMAACWYVDDTKSASNLGSCAGAPPSGATGVHVEVNETHNTFFMKVLGVNTVTTSAKATANVQIVDQIPGNGPYMVCGVGTFLEQGGKQNLLIKDGTGWNLDQAADQKIFKIHGPQIEDCGWHESSWKGIAWQDHNAGLPVPGWWEGENGDRDGPVVQAVVAPQGCDVGQTENCVMILPIVVPDPAPQDGASGNPVMYVVAFGAFYVTQTGNGKHVGRFYYEYSIRANGKEGWRPGSTHLTTIRLTE